MAVHFLAPKYSMALAATSTDLKPSRTPTVSHDLVKSLKPLARFWSPATPSSSVTLPPVDAKNSPIFFLKVAAKAGLKLPFSFSLSF